MNEQRDDAFARGVAQAILLGAHNAFHHGIDRFQMARIGRDGNDDLAGVGGLAHCGRAEVVLHVSGALRAGRVDFALEFGEDLFEVLAHHVGQNVEPAAVRHPDDDLVDIVGGGALQHLFQDRDRGLAALQCKSLLAHEAGVQEVLEFFGSDKVAQNAQTRFTLQRPVVLARFHAVLQPSLLFRRLDIHVLAADFPAIGIPQGLQNLAQGGDRLVITLADRFARRAGEELAIEIPYGESVSLGV